MQVVLDWQEKDLATSDKCRCRNLGSGSTLNHAIPRLHMSRLFERFKSVADTVGLSGAAWRKDEVMERLEAATRDYLTIHRPASSLLKMYQSLRLEAGGDHVNDGQHLVTK